VAGGVARRLSTGSERHNHGGANELADLQRGSGARDHMSGTRQHHFIRCDHPEVDRIASHGLMQLEQFGPNQLQAGQRPFSDNELLLEKGTDVAAVHAATNSGRWKSPAEAEA
jgi:hypothetical protein